MIDIGLSDAFLESNILVDQRPFGSWKAFISNDATAYDLQADCYFLSLYGVNVFTDSANLFNKLKKIAELENRTFTQTKGSLFHFTQNRKDLRDLIGNSVKTENSAVKKDELMIVHPDLKNFITFDIENFSSVLGNIFGIRSFLKSGSGYIGVHSSTILDSESGQIHIILGQTTAGKSSCAYLIEEMSNKKFIVIADDWSEINLNKKIVVPYFALLGEPRNAVARRYLVESKEFKKIFFDHDKSWYIRKSLPFIVAKGEIGLIFQLDVKSRIKNTSYIHRKNNTHIPFMNVNLGKDFSAEVDLARKKRIQEMVARKIYRLVRDYEGLAKWQNYYCIDAGSGDMQLIASNILSILKNNV